MITLKEAIDIAKRRNSKVDTYQEYEDAYEFFIDDGVVRIGGGDCSFVVRKSDGKILRFYQYHLPNPEYEHTVVEVGKPVKIDTIINVAEKS